VIVNVVTFILFKMTSYDEWTVFFSMRYSIDAVYYRKTNIYLLL